MYDDWIWKQPNWTTFTWKDENILPLTRHIHQKIGILLGQSQHNPEKEHLTLDNLIANLVSSSAIENETLNVYSLRSSLARHLGVSLDQPYPSSERSDGLANIMLDALNNFEQDLSIERLFQWHQWLFNETDWTMQRIRIGQLRGHEPMQVVSGRMDYPTVHFEAPPRDGLEQRVDEFVQWFNTSRTNTLLDPLIRAGITHLWFVTLHPFDDGNGRITRTLTDLALAQMDQQSIRLYAMSPVILNKRKSYYEILEATQKGGSDITDWLLWFLQALNESLEQTLKRIERTLLKNTFWQTFSEVDLHEGQRMVLNRLLDDGENGFEHGISASQYQKVARVSRATATRHLTDLLGKGCIVKLEGGGRNTRYQVRLKNL
ncbi:Fic family protein [Acinetobacter ursingii]|uniref:Fic family protein n=1 Tax=Acinetobacter ursingii TaxID=108980 RepID=A0AA46S7Q0_9GAMM|nr:Fic family protein [Acinetobacter ursingii]MCU4604836.1 Fic family protein [Acinetobacter ursingii]MDH2019435.1 Fic family protein [Acinetobacter ursingii]MDH2071827.1 Fic family protein [Acinetobacter ursingii]UYF76529.1 Fic family protein [Acinetobacter ursingii]